MIRTKIYRHDTNFEDVLPLETIVSEGLRLTEGVYYFYDKKGLAIALFPISKFYIYVEHDVT